MDIPKEIFTPTGVSWFKLLFFSLIVSSAIIGGTMKVVGFLDEKFGLATRENAERFYQKTDGKVLEEKVQRLEQTQSKILDKLTVIQEERQRDTAAIMRELGVLQGLLKK